MFVHLLLSVSTSVFRMGILFEVSSGLDPEMGSERSKWPPRKKIEKFDVLKDR
jgi:hypothetical protein